MNLKVRWHSIVHHELSRLVIVLLGILVVLGGLSHGRTLQMGNISNVWLQSSTRGVAALGQLLVILTGGIDLSVGGISLLCAIFGAAILGGQTGLPQLGIPESIALVLLLGLGLGAINGVLVARVRIPPLIATLGLWQIVGGISLAITTGRTLRGIPEAVNFFGGERLLAYLCLSLSLSAPQW